MQVRSIVLHAIVLALGVGYARSQVIVGNYGIQYVSSAPSGACSSTAPMMIVVGAGTAYTCQGGTWALLSGGGGSGFPFTLGATSVAASSSNPSLTGLSFLSVNGLVSTTASLTPGTDVAANSVEVQSVANPSVDLTNFLSGTFVEHALEGSHTMYGAAGYFDLGVGNPSGGGDTLTATEAISVLGEVDINSAGITAPDVAGVAGVWFPGPGPAAIQRISAFWASPQGATGALEAYGYRADSIAGMGTNRAAAFYSVDQGSGANDYAIYIAGDILISSGTQTVSGCSLSASSGGKTAGKFTSGTSGTCTVTVTPGTTAPNGYSCFANDITTPADKLQQTVASTTAPVISGTTASGDVITWGCMAF